MQLILGGITIYQWSFKTVLGYLRAFVLTIFVQKVHFLRPLSIFGGKANSKITLILLFIYLTKCHIFIIVYI